MTAPLITLLSLVLNLPDAGEGVADLHEVGSKVQLDMVMRGLGVNDDLFPNRERYSTADVDRW